MNSLRSNVVCADFYPYYGPTCFQIGFPKQICIGTAFHLPPLYSGRGESCGGEASVCAAGRMPEPTRRNGSCSLACGCSAHPVTRGGHRAKRVARPALSRCYQERARLSGGGREYERHCGCGTGVAETEVAQGQARRASVAPWRVVSR